MKWILTLPLATSLLLAVASPSQSLAKYQDEHLLKLRDELIPLVEKITGERFQAPPKIRSIGPGDLTKILRKELAPQINVLYPEVPTKRRALLLEATVSSTASSLIAKYAFGKRELLVSPAKIPAFLYIIGKKKADTKKLLKLYVAHELVHAMQDQKVEIGAWIHAARDVGAMRCLNFCIEGHAQHVAGLIAKSLGFDDDWKTALSLTRIDGSARKRLGGLQNINMRDTRADAFVYYNMGKAHFDALHAKGGAKACWELLRKRPSRSLALLTGRKQKPVKEAKHLPDDLLEGFFATFMRGKRYEAESPLSPISLICAWIPGGEKAILEACKQIEEGRERRLSRSAIGSKAIVRVFRMRDEASAKQLRLLAMKAYEGERPYMEDFEIAKLDRDAWDSVTRCVMIGKAAAFSRKLELLLLRKGRDVVELQLTAVRRKDEKLFAALDALAKKLGS